MPSLLPWFDAHLDMAYLAEGGRDMRVAAEAATAPAPPAAVTFPALAEGPVRAALGTIFIQRRITDAAQAHDNADGPWTFSSPDEAHAAAARQMAIYGQWQSAGLIRLVTRGGDLAPGASAGAPLDTIVLMEGASGVRTVGDLQAFYAAGVRVLSLTWAEGNHWSGGNSGGGDLTAAGRELVAEMDRLGMVHDVSHLSEAAFWSVMKLARGPVMASHSNCRALLPVAKSPERHLSDDQLRALAGAGAVIGVVLFSHFLVGSGRANSADVLRHIAHIEKITGRRDAVALGSDMDGGFSAAQLPADVDHPRRLPALTAALARAGWSQDQCAGFAYDHWAAFFRRALK